MGSSQLITVEELAVLARLALEHPALLEKLSEAITLAGAVSEVLKDVAATDAAMDTIAWAVSVMVAYCDGRPVNKTDLGSAISIANGFCMKRDTIYLAPTTQPIVC